MGVYQAPVHSSTPSSDDWASYSQLHLGFYPPLLRSSTVKKFLVGCVLFSFCRMEEELMEEQVRAVRGDAEGYHTGTGGGEAEGMCG